MSLKRTLLIALILLSSGWLTACGAKDIQRPSGVAQAANGSLYVMDLGNHRIAHLDANGRLIGSIGSFGKNREQIFLGYDLAIDAQGNLYICNKVTDDEGTRHDGVKVFSPEGAFVREIGGNEYLPGADTRRPYGLDLDNSGRVYLADYGTGTVRVYRLKGEFLGELFANPEDDIRFKGLNDVAVDDTRSLLYTADQDRGQINQYQLSFDGNGAPVADFIQAIATYGKEAGQVAFPQYLVVNDASGYLYVGDLANRRIQIFDAEGRFVASFTPPAEVQDWQSMGLAIGLEDNILVADALNNVIWKLTPEGVLIERIEVK